MHTIFVYMKKRTTFIFTAEAKRLLKDMAVKYGVTQTGMLEMLIRDRAKAEGLWQ